MEKSNDGLKTYIFFLTFSWVIISVYMIFFVKIENHSQDEIIKKELESSYPFEHSKITDSTLQHGK